MRSRLAIIVPLAALLLAAVACTPTVPPASTGASSTATGSADATATQMQESNPDAESLLTVADVQATTGMSGLKLVPRNTSTDALGRLNFANSDGTLVAIMTIGDGTAFEESMAGMIFSREATGTGDMCYVGPSPQVSDVLSVFAAAKGDHAIIMRTFAKTEGGKETWLSIDQLQQLVGLALSRWQ